MSSSLLSLILWIFLACSLVGEGRASIIHPIHDTRWRRRRNVHSVVRKQENPAPNRQRRVISFHRLLQSESKSLAPIPGSSRPLAFTPTTGFGGLIVLFSALSYATHQIWKNEGIRRATYFWVHAGPIVAHYKFARWFLERSQAPIEERDRIYNQLHDKYCQKSLDIAMHLKGLYVKMAQIVSSRPDFVPPQYIELFTTAQDSLPQTPVDDIVQAIDENLQSNHGLSFDEVFESIDQVALGSASIGQVHRATLKPSFSSTFHQSPGSKTPTMPTSSTTNVAVKVMHPGVEQRFHHDFQVFRKLCDVALTGWAPILDECYRQIMSEFDYRHEGKALDTACNNLQRSPFRRRVRIPRPHFSLTTKEVLVMEMLQGKKLSDALEEDLKAALGGDSSLAEDFLKQKRLEIILGKENVTKLGKSDRSAITDGLGLRGKLKLFRLYRKVKRYIDLLVDVQGYQILEDGFFNGDPHPGNLMELPNGRLGLIDYGQTKALSNRERIGVARVVHALYHSDEKQIADTMRQLGFQTKNNSDEVLAKFAALFFDSDIEAKSAGCSTPQIFFAKLSKEDPLVKVPDIAIFVARASFIIRGMGTMLDRQIQTSERWSKQAKNALANEGDDRN